LRSWSVELAIFTRWEGSGGLLITGFEREELGRRQGEYACHCGVRGRFLMIMMALIMDLIAWCISDCADGALTMCN
jgi:hypothetical protein